MTRGFGYGSERKRRMGGMAAALCASLLLLMLGASSAINEELPIGLIIDDNDAELERAFEFAMMIINTDPSFLQTFSQRRVLKAVVKNRTSLDDNYLLGSAICSLMGKGVLAIVGTSRPSTFNTIQSYSHALHVPYILAGSTRYTDKERYRYDVSVYPPFHEIVHRLIDYANWDMLYYVYDSDDGLWRLQTLYERFQNKTGKETRLVDAYRVTDAENSYELLRQLDYKNHFYKRIILDLSSADAYKKLLDQIIGMGMNRDNYHYILSGLDALDLNHTDFFSAFTHGGVNITGFSAVSTTSDTYAKWYMKWNQFREQYPNLFPLKTNTAFMMDAVQALFLAVTGTYRHGGLFPSRRRGRPELEVKCRADNPSHMSDGEPIIQQLNQIRFDGLTGKVAFNEHGIRSDFSIDQHELSHKRPLQKVATWNPKRIKETDGIQRKVYNSTAINRTQRITTYIEKPFAMRKNDFNGEPPVGPNEQYEGYCIDLIEMVAKNLGFDYVIYPSSDYGRKNETGHWVGMVGELVRKERDIAVASLTITEERERVVDFSKPFMNTGLSIMIKKPDKQKPGVFSFMEPLDGMVWLCIAIGFLAVSFVLFFVGRFSPFEWNVEKTDKDTSVTNVFNISNTMWFSLGALMQQGSDISPRSLSGRIIGSAWWFFTLIIISSYTANLAAFLTIEKLLTPISSADDLVEQTDIKYGTRASGSSYDFFKESEVLTYKRMFQFMNDHKDEVLVERIPDGVDKVRKGKSKYAFLLESSMNTFYSQQEPCDTMMVGGRLNNNGYGIATYIGHPKRQEINIEVLELREIGELHKLEQKWWYDKGKCGDQDTNKDTSQSALTLSNVSGIFHILIGGLVLAMLTSSIEYVIQKKFREKRRKNKLRKAKESQPPDRRSFTPFQQVSTSHTPEQENGGYGFAPPGQLITFEPPTTSNQTEI